MQMTEPYSNKMICILCEGGRERGREGEREGERAEVKDGADP